MAGDPRQVTLFIGGMSREIKFTFNALCELEEVVKRPLAELMDSAPGLSLLRAFLYAGLRGGRSRGWKDITPETVGEWLEQEGIDFARLNEIIGDAIGMAMGGKFKAAQEETLAEDNSKNAASPGTGTGTNSGQTESQSESQSGASGV